MAAPRSASTAPPCRKLWRASRAATPDSVTACTTSRASCASSSTSTSMTPTSDSARDWTRPSASATRSRSSPPSPEAPALGPDDPLDALPREAVVAVAMSGGVDSSVVAARVAARGIRAVGITLAMWPRDREIVRDRGCCSIDAVEDARRVAASLGMRHYAWNLEREFEDIVIDAFVAEREAGRTPNPCVTCNRSIKFGLFLDRAHAIGATHVATGHYARLGRRGDAITLHRAVDAQRDQAYVLHRLDQRQLAAAVFPLGGAASKAAVRAEAEALGLVTAANPESQDLCFVSTTVQAELERRGGAGRAGPVMDRAGAVVGS